MSSTKRGGIREVSDYYVTPIDEIILFLDHLISEVPDLLTKPNLSILDPCAGGDSLHEMSYPIALAHCGVTSEKITTIDIREDSKADIKADYFKIVTSDLNQWELSRESKFDIIITNPPFSHALPIIKKAFIDTKFGGYVIMLLRLNFFGSQARFPFWRDYLPKYCFVHHKRMSFTDFCKTDSIEYMHAVWHVGHRSVFTELKVI